MHYYALSIAMKLVILYSKGGLGDVGRHAVQAALERPNNEITEIKVLSQHIETLQEENWNCGCTEPHRFTDEDRKRIELIQVDSWDDNESLLGHFEGAGAVISCLGNRQMTLGDRVGGEGSRMVVKAMKRHKISRALVMSSMGIGNDWPPLEYHWAGKVLKLIFLSCGKKDYKDLAAAEEAFQSSSKDIDYLIVRPVGLGEECVPRNKWLVQKEKYKDTSLDINLAKLDCARFMVEEALAPTRHRMEVVLGAPMPEKEE